MKYTEWEQLQEWDIYMTTAQVLNAVDMVKER